MKTADPMTWVRKCEYPGWTIRCRPGNNEQPGPALCWIIDLKRMAPCNYNPGQEVVVWRTAVVHPWMDEQQFMHVVRSMIHDIECHEADERFRYDGRMVFDPHAKDGLTA